jgi:hypothetical protein
MRLVMWNDSVSRVDVRWTWLPWFVANGTKLLAEIDGEINGMLEAGVPPDDALLDQMSRHVIDRLSAHYDLEELTQLLLQFRHAPVA